MCAWKCNACTHLHNDLKSWINMNSNKHFSFKQNIVYLNADWLQHYLCQRCFYITTLDTQEQSLTNTSSAPETPNRLH